MAERGDRALLSFGGRGEGDDGEGMGAAFADELGFAGGVVDLSEALGVERVDLAAEQSGERGAGFFGAAELCDPGGVAVGDEGVAFAGAHFGYDGIHQVVQFEEGEVVLSPQGGGEKDEENEEGCAATAAVTV